MAALRNRCLTLNLLAIIRFGGTCRLRFQSRTIIQAANQHEATRRHIPEDRTPHNSVRDLDLFRSSRYGRRCPRPAGSSFQGQTPVDTSSLNCALCVLQCRSNGVELPSASGERSVARNELNLLRPPIHTQFGLPIDLNRQKCYSLASPFPSSYMRR
jgi:hypothetical protein